jgi:hypothetical protein
MNVPWVTWTCEIWGVFINFLNIFKFNGHKRFKYSNAKKSLFSSQPKASNLKAINFSHYLFAPVQKLTALSHLSAINHPFVAVILTCTRMQIDFTHTHTLAVRARGNRKMSHLIRIYVQDLKPRARLYYSHVCIHGCHHFPFRNLAFYYVFICIMSAFDVCLALPFSSAI